jgi:hypothetical protein
MSTANGLVEMKWYSSAAKLSLASPFQPNLITWHKDQYLNLCLSLWCTAADSLRLWPLQVLRRDPRRIKSLCTRGHSRPISANNGGLLSWINAFRALCGCFGPLAALAAALRLWEQGFDPCAVDEVDGTREDGEEEEVEEDAVSLLAMPIIVLEELLHLWIQE